YYFQHRIVPSIEFVNRTEPLLYEIRQNITCNIGIEFRDHVDDQFSFEQFLYEHFAIHYNKYKRCLNVILANDSTDKDLLHCLFLLQIIIRSLTLNSESHHPIRNVVYNSTWIDLKQLRTHTDPLYQDFLTKANSQGWDIAQAKFLTKSYRYG
ncbi:unnamed protein product, partial [Didymodactylos carnosus]